MARRPRSLWPKEHGAYAQLLVPLLTGFAAGWPPSLASLGWGLAAVLAFLAHEPALVRLGQRGPRAQTEAGARALRALLGLASLAALGAAAGWALGPVDVWVLGAESAAAALAVVVVAAGRGRSTLGEWTAAIALSGAGTLVAAASGEPASEGFVRWGAWGLGFGAATGGVRGVIAAHRKRTEALAAPLAVGCSLGCGLGGFAEPGLWSAAPLCASSVVLLAVRPHARHLKKIGVALVAVAAAVAALQLFARA